MSTTVGQLTIEMAANVARLRADMDEAKRMVGSAVDDMRSTIEVLKMTFAGIGAAVSVDAVVGEFKRAVKTMAELDDAAEKAGTSVENISRLLGVAAESGTSLQGVVDATTKLSRAMVNAEKDTSRAAEAFKLLGIDPGTYKDTTDLLIDVARAMYGYEDSAQKTQLALAIFGKTGAELLPLMKDLGAATNLTATHSSEAAAEAEKLEKAFAKMRYESDLAKQQLASEMVPWIARMVQQFNEGRAAAGGFWAAMLRYGVGFAPGQGVEEVEKNIARITAQIKANEEALQNSSFFGGAARSATQSRLESLRAELTQANKDLAYFSKTAGTASQSAWAFLHGDAGYGPRPDAPKLSDGLGEAGKAAAEAARKLNDAYFQVLGVQKDYTEKVREYETLLKTGKITQDEYTSAIKRLGESQPVVKQYTEDQAKASKELEAAQKKEHDTLKELAKLYEDAQKPIKDLNTEADNALKKAQDEYAQIGLTKTELGNLTAKRWDEKAALVQQQIEEANTTGALGTEYTALVGIKTKYEETARLIREGSRLTAIQDEAKKAADAYKETSGVIEKSLTDALLRGFEGGKGFAQNLVQSMKNLFNTLILRPVIQAVVQPVAGAITGMFGLSGTANAAGNGLNLLSGASNLSSLFGPSGAIGGMGTTLATSSIGQTLGLSTVWTGADGAAVAALSGTGSALSALGTALPYLGVGLALASAFGLFDSKGGPKTGGSYDSSGSIGRLFTPADADQSASTIGAGILDSIKNTVGDLGGTAADLQLAFGFDKDPQGTAGSRLASLLRTKSGNVLVDDRTGVNVGRDDSTFTAGVASESARLVLAGIKASTLPDDIRAIFDRLDVSTVTSDQLANAIKDAKALVPKSDAQTALDAALNDPGTQAAVSTEVSRLIDVQERSLKVQEDQRDRLDTQIDLVTALGKSLVERFTTAIEAIEATRQAVVDAATAPSVVRA